MPYIVRSSLDIGSTIIPWNEQESNRLMKEKKEYLEKKAVEQVVKEPEVLIEIPQEEVKPEVEESKEEKKSFKNSKKNQKAGEK